MMYQSLIFQRRLVQPQQQAAFFIRGECTGKRFDRQPNEKPRRFCPRDQRGTDFAD